VQEEGCLALSNIANGNAYNQRAIAAHGGISVVVSAMKAHSGHVGIQDSGCRALANLAANADNTIAIAAAGGIRVVILAIKAH